ncbi:MAG: HD domain-containing protein [Bacteroidetes bacterium]|nr:HD domain-containing protein [Bacteroidota bacterium]
MLKNLLEVTIKYVKEILTEAEGGHDWFHIERVWKNAKLIAAKELCDLEVVQLAALLHDIADSKFHGGNEEIGPAMAREFLENAGLEPQKIDHIVAIVENVSFKGGQNIRSHSSIELDIVQDADRLDAIGAIGIARTFNYGGYKNRAIYDPAIAPNLNMTKEEYKKSTAPTINHFYEKLLLLIDRMNTQTGKDIALERHRFMETFLDQFYAEWDGLR